MTSDDLILGNARLYSVGQLARIAEGEVFERGKMLSGSWRAFKTLVILNGAEATLRIPQRDRASFLLAYDLSKTENFAYTRQSGQAEVRFANCRPSKRALEFPGALLARRPGCFHIEAISRRGVPFASRVINIAMGRGNCPSH